MESIFAVALVIGLLLWIALAFRVLDPSSRPWAALRRYWHPEYIVRGVALLFIALAAACFLTGWQGQSRFADTFAPNLATDFFSLAITILVIDQLYRWRDNLTQQQIDKSLAAERKRNIIQQMGSQSNEFARQAVRIAETQGWLKDGSLKEANLVGSCYHMLMGSHPKAIIAAAPAPTIPQIMSQGFERATNLPPYLDDAYASPVFVTSNS